MALPRELTTRRDDRHGSKLGDIFRRMTTNSEGEAFAGMRAIARLLAAHGQTFHELADHLENGGGGLSEDDKKKIRSEIENARAIGYAEGVKAAESKQHGTGEFRNTRSIGRKSRFTASARSTAFLASITSSSTIWPHAPCTGREPTPKQHQYLHSLFYKLGGKIT
jgi:hypothetical protein